MLIRACVACVLLTFWAANSHAGPPAFVSVAPFEAQAGVTRAQKANRCNAHNVGLVFAPHPQLRLPGLRSDAERSTHVLRMAVGGKGQAAGRAKRLQEYYAKEEGLDTEDDEEDEKQQQMAPIAEGDRLSLIIDQKLLSQHLALVCRAVNPTIGRHYSILNNVLLRADAATNTLALAGYDLSMGIETRLREGVTVKQSGIVAAPAKVISEMIAKLPQGDLEVICETKTLLIRSVGIGSHAYNIRVMSTDDYPALPAVQSEDIIIEGSDFLDGIGGVMYACAIDDTAALLKGAHVRLLPGPGETSVEFAATDGHRLAVHRMVLGGQLCHAAISATIPRPSLLEIERLVRLSSKPSSPSVKGGTKTRKQAGAGGGGAAPGAAADNARAASCPLAIRIDSEYAQFVLGPRKGVWTAVRIFSRLYDGIFPNYDELMPKSYSRGWLSPHTPHPTPHTPHPTPHTPHPTPHTPHPTPHTPHPTPHTLHPTPYTLHPTPYTLHPTPYTLHPRSCPRAAAEVGPTLITTSTPYPLPPTPLA
jgi:DNA polymerase III sliding clamp (beta) subunit (PCNA family)